MPLRLCAACDRHVRVLDAACPYCGAAGARPVPATPPREVRSAMLFGVGTLVITALEASCSSVIAVYGAPGGWGPEAGSRPPDTTPTRDAREAAPALGCHDPGAPLDLPGAAPLMGTDRCTRAQIAGLLPACPSGLETNATCRAYLSANAACASCLLGPDWRLDGGIGPVGALVQISESQLAPNVSSCAALVIGRPDCSLLVAQEAVCVASSCVACPDDPTCNAAARAGICSDYVNAGCDAELRAREAEWKPVCAGATFEEAYGKVAWVLCGSPATGGAADASPDDARSRD